MKKIYLTICLGAFIIIASVLLFPVTAHSQDLTEEEKKERCQNNKNRIAEFEAELKIITAELSQTMEKKEIEDARTQMVDVRRMKNLSRSGTALDWKKYDMISAQYNFKNKDCFDTNYNIEDVNAYVVCLDKLEKIIAKKIDKAESLNRPALLAKKNETEKLLAAHRNNLVALGCDAPKKDDGSFDSKLSGYWELESGSPYGGNTQLAVTNGVVSGSSQRNANAVIKITGGSYDAATKKLSITYIQEWSKRTGKAYFDFGENSANYILTGTWVDDVSGRGTWIMMKKK
jgi:hypothetical protein